MLKRYLLGFVSIKKILKFFTFKNIIRAFSYMIIFKLVYFIVYRYLDTEFLGTFLSSIIAGSILIIFKFIFLGLVEGLITPLYCDEDDYDNNDESSKSKENNDRETELNTMIDNYKKEEDALMIKWGFIFRSFPFQWIYYWRKWNECYLVIKIAFYIGAIFATA